MRTTKKYYGNIRSFSAARYTTVVLKNTKTGKEYDSDAEGDADVDNPDTDTKREDISRSVYIKVAKMPEIGSES